ncbi:MAG: hypothetical protein WA476_10815, partial [Acidobacteriaceae bacterium]
AFNALLKTLEEPPDHIVFMLATTQPEDIPQTIRSRCQHFSFHAVKFDDILAQLQSIAAQEEIDAEAAALSLLAEAGDGSMRDALSIMDQAIASAPVVKGQPHLESEPIRELMGAVPNTVFERLMEQISAGQTAAVIEESNTLLNAGNSPSALARQFVRYLRNALMARIGGENSDLLQISADERARAARSAMLFSEEDLTRFLQVMLRTFDELNYRQEQRFHLELGLVKLVHLQRLLPVEELLSGIQGSELRALGSGDGPRSTGYKAESAPQGMGHRVQGAAQSSGTAGPAAASTRVTAAPVAAPRPSPFEADRERKASGESGASAEPAARALSPAESVGRAAAEAQSSSFQAMPPAPEAKPVAAVGLAESLADVTDGALALAPEAPPDLDRIRDAVSVALAREGHETAANLIHQGSWTQQGNAIQVELAVRKTMLALTVNAEAEAICRKTMRAMGATQKIAFVPGENGVKAGYGKEGPTPIAGSAQSAAMENPLVQKTKELFNADIRSVLDLRDPD